MSFEDQGGSGQFAFVVLVETQNQHIWLAENSLSFNSSLEFLGESNSWKIQVIMTTSSMMNMKLRVTNTLNWDASTAWLSALNFPMRSSDQMSIEKTHPTLIFSNRVCMINCLTLQPASFEIVSILIQQWMRTFKTWKNESWWNNDCWKKSQRKLFHYTYHKK